MIKKSIFASVFFFLFSSVVLANPGLLWGLVKEASIEGPASARWQQIEKWLLEDPTENIDWNPEGEPTTREILREHNNALYQRFFEQGKRPFQPVQRRSTPTGITAYKSSEQVLGVGFTGEVMRAVHRLSGAEVAIKTILRTLYEQHRLPFPPNEPDFMRRLNHPNIVRLYHTILTNSEMCIVMELVPGRDLFTVSQNNIMPEMDCRPIVQQILAGVHHMHRQNICHRDLKLENVIIDGRGRIKLIDFGFACVFDPTGNNLISDFCCSPEYAAPEIFLRQPYVGPEVDVWAIGSMVFTLTTDMIPFEPLDEAVNLNYEWPGDVTPSAELGDFIARIFVFAAQRCNVEDLQSHPWLKDKDERQ